MREAERPLNQHSKAWLKGTGAGISDIREYDINMSASHYLSEKIVTKD